MMLSGGLFPFNFSRNVHHDSEYYKQSDESIFFQLKRVKYQSLSNHTFGERDVWTIPIIRMVFSSER